jgi:phage-related protein
MLALLERVAESGPPRNVDISHSLRGDVWEFSQGSLRILWFYAHGRVVICSHAFAKKGRKIPAGEIAHAQRTCDEYRAARGQVEIIGDEEDE